MDQDSLKYLKTEREISRFKIEHLKKISHRGDASTRRLLAIEEEFVTIPFEKITSNLSDLLSAIKIFRDSRNAFYDLYPADNTSSPTFSKAIDHVSNEIKDIIKKINLEVSNLKIKNARDKARVLIILISIFLYLEKSKEEISAKNININELDLLKEMMSRYSLDIFSFYNEIIKEASSYSFLSENSKSIISEIRPLVNFSKDDGPSFLNITPQKIRGKLIFGFYLNSKHSGRETLRPYYMRLYDEDGMNISKIFSSNPKIIPINGEYYKFIYLNGPEEFNDNIILLERFESLMKKIFHLKLSGKNNLKINTEESIILVPSSRTEDEGLKSALIESSAIFSNILKSII
jgi:hypothetical protein